MEYKEKEKVINLETKEVVEVVYQDQLTREVLVKNKNGSEFWLFYQEIERLEDV